MASPYCPRLGACLRQRTSLAPLRGYQRRMRRQETVYFSFIYGWYQQGFLELFLSPTRKFKMLQAITSLLAGRQHDWRVDLRMRLFLLLVQLNRFLPLAPPIDRAGLPPAHRQ